MHDCCPFYARRAESWLDCFKKDEGKCYDCRFLEELLRHKLQILMRLHLQYNLLLLLLPVILGAQQPDWEGGVQAGLTGYQGELSKGLLPELSETGGSYGFLVRRYLSPAFALRLDARYASLSGTDKGVYKSRQFSFEGDYLTAGIKLEWEPWGRRRYPDAHRFQKRLSPYCFTGISWIQYHPKADFIYESQNGELEHIAADRQRSFPMNGILLPFGIGLKADLSRVTVVGFELSTATAFSDYLDGISEAGNPHTNDWLPAAAVTFTFRLMPKDTDRDGIADEKDACPRVKGAWAAMGCPDGDLDGVEDLEDLCPDTPGSPKLNGCPDRDADGVADRADRCPERAGSILTYGCPDRDVDGLADFEDECPKLPGSKGRRGCPPLDSDADGELEDEPTLCWQQPKFPSPLDWPNQVEAVFQMLKHYRYRESNSKQLPLSGEEHPREAPDAFDF